MPGDVFKVDDGRDARLGQGLARARSNGLGGRNSTLEKGGQMFDEKSSLAAGARSGIMFFSEGSIASVKLGSVDVYGRAARQYFVEC